MVSITKLLLLLCIIIWAYSLSKKHWKQPKFFFYRATGMRQPKGSSWGLGKWYPFAWCCAFWNLNSSRLPFVFSIAY